MENLRSNVEKHLHSVCLHPSRHVGSPGVKAAADYIEKTFREYGYSDVVQEKFDSTGWRFGHMIFVDLDNSSTAVPGALPCFFSRSADVEGVPLWLTEENIKELAYKCSFMGKRTVGKVKALDIADMEAIYRAAR